MTNTLNRNSGVNGLKVSFLVKQPGDGPIYDVYRMIPWDIPNEDVQVFDPYQEWLTCVIAGLKTDERDLRDCEFINMLMAVNDQPVFWTSAEHLFARTKVDPEKRATREARLQTILEKAGMEYDAKQSGKDIPTSLPASSRRH